MSLLYGLITQDYSTEIPWEGLQQTAVCYKRPFTKTSHRESNMLSYEDDKAPPSNTSTHKGDLWDAHNVGLSWNGHGFSKSSSITQPHWSMHFHD